MIFSSFLARQLPAGVPSAMVVGAKKFWHFVIGPGLKRRYLGAQKELEGVLGL